QKATMSLWSILAGPNYFLRWLQTGTLGKQQAHGWTAMVLTHGRLKIGVGEIATPGRGCCSSGAISRPRTCRRYGESGNDRRCEKRPNVDADRFRCRR